MMTTHDDFDMAEAIARILHEQMQWVCGPGWASRQRMYRRKRRRVHGRRDVYTEHERAWLRDAWIRWSESPRRAFYEAPPRRIRYEAGRMWWHARARYEHSSHGRSNASVSTTGETGST